MSRPADEKSVRIGRFPDRHLERCTGIFVETFNAEPLNGNWTVEAARAELDWTMRVPGFFGLVISDGHAGGDLLGFAVGYREPAGEGEVFYLRTLCVVPRAQGRGLGKAPLQRLEEEPRDTGK